MSDKANTIIVDGTEYPVRPLGLAEWGEFVDWVQTRYVTIIRAKLAECKIAPADAVNIMGQAFLRLPSIGRFSEETRGAMGTNEGTTRFLWLAVRHALPIPFEEFRAKYEAQATDE